MALRMWGQVVLQTTMPAEDPVMVGTLWADTSTDQLKQCTSISPYTFVTIGGTGATLGAHATQHQNNGSDELDVTGLSGLLADKQTPLPAGGTTQVQFNNAGTQAGDADLTFVTDTLTVTKVVAPTSVSTPALISTGAVSVTPAAGSNLNVALSTTGDLAVNTNQVYVDTSAGTVGINTSTPLSTLSINGGLHVGGDSAAGDNNALIDGTATAATVVATTAVTTPAITAAAGLSITPAGSGVVSVVLSGTGSVNVSSSGGGGTALLDIANTNADASGPAIRITKDSASPANNDVVGYNIFRGRDAGGGFNDYGIMTVVSTDVGAGTEKSTFSFTTLDGGVEAEAMALAGKNLGVGVTPSTRFHVRSADNNINTTLQINATQANIDGNDKWVSFTSNSGEEANVVGTGVLGVVAYNTFTGAHKTLVTGPAPTTLMLLEMTGERIPASEFTSRGTVIPPRLGAGGVEVEPSYRRGPATKEFLPYTRTCSTIGSKACFGVFAGSDASGMSMALALGTGWILVANKGANLQAGDYLISSDVAGHAERQSDDIKRASTVASVSEHVQWRLNETTRQVACRYLMG